MKLKELTPKEMYCGNPSSGCCPALFETEKGSYVLIGRKLEGSEAKELTGRIAGDEVAVEILAELLSKLNK